jgi:hypothetical protein
MYSSAHVSGGRNIFRETLYILLHRHFTTLMLWKVQSMKTLFVFTPPPLSMFYDLYSLAIFIGFLSSLVSDVPPVPDDPAA